MITAKYTLTIRGQAFELTNEEAEALRIHATHTIQPIRNCSASQEPAKHPSFGGTALLNRSEPTITRQYGIADATHAVAGDTVFVTGVGDVKLTPAQFRERFANPPKDKTEPLKPLPDTHIIPKSISGF